MASLNEGSKRKDYGKKGGQGGTRSTSSTPYERRESRANMQDPSNTRNKKLGTDKPRVIKAPDGSVTYTNMPEPSGSVTTDQVIDTADRRARLRPIKCRVTNVESKVLRSTECPNI